MAVALPEAAGEPAGDGTGAAEQRGAGHGALRTVSSEHLAIDYGVYPASGAYMSRRDGVYLYMTYPGPHGPAATITSASAPTGT